MRVIAVSAESSLAAALNMMDGWEVVFATDENQAEQVARGASVVLAGGGTDRGLGIVAHLRARGLEVPAVVMGDDPPPEGTETIVLTPPFTLDELRAAVEGAARFAPPTDAPAAPPVPPAVESRHPEGNGSLGRIQDLQETPVLPPVEPAEPSPAPSGEEPAARVEPPRIEEEAAPVPVQEEAPLVPEAPPAPAETVTEVAAPAPVVPQPVVTPAPAPVISPPPAPVPERSGWRKKRRGSAEVPAATVAAPVSDLPIAPRLYAAEDAVRAVTDVVAEMPFLADIETLANALISEVVEAFEPEIAVLYLPGDAGFWVAAGYQLTASERRLTVKPDQPLFREMLAGGEPILIAPLDLARAMVGGIAGARTEAWITGPIRGRHGCVGVIIVGRGDFEDKDLDRLAVIANEAAPGFGFAEAFDRLRAFRP